MVSGVREAKNAAAAGEPEKPSSFYDDVMQGLFFFSSPFFFSSL
jgi:hypothetical protein